MAQPVWRPVLDALTFGREKHTAGAVILSVGFVPHQAVAFEQAENGRDGVGIGRGALDD